VGTYEVQCTELCGSGHGGMVFKNIHVLSKADFAKWLAGAKKEQADAQKEAQSNPGQAVFNTSGCGGCHTFTPAKTSGTTGPKLDDLTASYDEAKAAGKTKATDLAGFIKESIVEPNEFVAKGYSPGIMPDGFGSSLKPKQIDDLAGYLAKGGTG
jgi:heme/copper-type cytochrome/quinol oxidase subunit 2